MNCKLHNYLLSMVCICNDGCRILKWFLFADYNTSNNYKRT